MFERIVVPVDGSPASEAIFGTLEHLAGHATGELVVVHVAAIAPAYPVEGVPVLVAERSAGYLESLERRFAGREPKVKIVEKLGSPADAILEVARAEHATMIAMATHGRHGLGRLLFGSVTAEVLRASPIPVLTVKTTQPAPLPGLVRSLIVPLDGRPESRAALPPAVEIARHLDARLLLLRVVDPAREVVSDAEHALQEACGEVVRAGVIAHALVEEGPPAPAIRAAAEACHADLIVMATHGRSGLARMQEGSVTEDVLREAPSPLLAVRAERVPVLAPQGMVQEGEA